jgi:hypothetical protein
MTDNADTPAAAPSPRYVRGNAHSDIFDADSFTVNVAPDLGRRDIDVMTVGPLSPEMVVVAMPRYDVQLLAKGIAAVPIPIDDRIKVYCRAALAAQPEGTRRFACAEFEGCTETHCAYPGDEFCEHDRLAAQPEGETK